MSSVLRIWPQQLVPRTQGSCCGLWPSVFPFVKWKHREDNLSSATRCASRRLALRCRCCHPPRGPRIPPLRCRGRRRPLGRPRRRTRPKPRLASGVFPSPSCRAVALRPRPDPSSAAGASAERPRVGNGGAGGGESAEPGVAVIPASRGGSGCVRRRRRLAAAAGRLWRRCRGRAETLTGRERAAGRGSPGARRAGLGGADGRATAPRGSRGPSFSLCPQRSSGLARSLVPASTAASPQLIHPDSCAHTPAFSLRTSRCVAHIRTHRPRHPSSSCSQKDHGPSSTHRPCAGPHSAPRRAWTQGAHLSNHRNPNPPQAVSSGGVRTSRSLHRNRLLQLISLPFTGALDSQ